ncbi:MAG: RNA-binding S4 domain-containing protein, partial [Sulfurimonadaceae bacterium]|nr:RNA-binding S4 domain-containing protein [Sulfurimonadaceae bacterium]
MAPGVYRAALKGIKMTYKLTEEYIELYKLIKVLDLVDSGGEAKQLIEHGVVVRNGEVETRKRAKIKAGEVITIG